MKLKTHMIAAAAALALTALAGSASAAIISPITGNSSLVLFAWDTAGPANQSYAFNTGLTLNDVLAMPASQTFNAGGSAVFSNFFSSADIQSGAVLFTLLAGDAQSTNQTIITTGLTAPGWQPSPSPVANVNGWFDGAASNLNPTSQPYVQPNGVEYTMTDLSLGNGNLLQPLLAINAPNGGAQFGTVGQSLNVYSSVTIPNAGTPRQPIQFPATASQLDLTFMLEANGQLDLVNTNVSPVPEPDAFWLMGSGLVAVAAFIRRRSVAAA